MPRTNTGVTPTMVASNLVTWYKPAQLASLLGVSEHKLRRWRVQRKGPPFIKLGDTDQAKVVYSEAAVIEWQKQQRMVETEGFNETEKAS